MNSQRAAWEVMKALHPLEAGVIKGTANFVHPWGVGVNEIPKGLDYSKWRQSAITV